MAMVFLSSCIEKNKKFQKKSKYNVIDYHQAYEQKKKKQIKMKTKKI